MSSSKKMMGPRKEVMKAWKKQDIAGFVKWLEYDEEKIFLESYGYLYDLFNTGVDFVAGFEYLNEIDLFSEDIYPLVQSLTDNKLVHILDSKTGRKMQSMADEEMEED